MTYCMVDQIYDLLKLLFRHGDIVCLNRLNIHGGELCIISSYRICEEHMGTTLLGASSTEMMQDFPLHV